MHRILTLIFNRIFTLTSLFAQDAYQESELISFTKIYIESKQTKEASIADFESMLKRHDVDLERYRSILKASLVGGTQNLNANEKALMNEIKAINKNIGLEKESQVDQLCEKYQLEFSVYKAIENKYKTDIQFQRSLQPYFLSQINQK